MKRNRKRKNPKAHVVEVDSMRCLRMGERPQPRKPTAFELTGRFDSIRLSFPSGTITPAVSHGKPARPAKVVGGSPAEQWNHATHGVKKLR